MGRDDERTEAAGSSWLSRHAALACLGMMFAAMLPLALLPHPGWPAIMAAALAVPLAAMGAARIDRRTPVVAVGAASEIEVRAARAAPRVSIVEIVDAALAQAPGVGMIGLIEFSGFSKLASFDPMFAERARAQLQDRMRRMIGPRRPIGTAGHARAAIWFGGDVGEAAVRAELEAIRYALVDAIDVDGRSVTPELRIACVGVMADESAELLLARAVATLATGDAGQGSGPATAGAAHAFALEQDLRHAATRGELRIDFQPLIDGVAGRVCGAEALLRWRHPELGLIPPSEFIPIAEHAGLAEEIGLWTLNAATREARGWARLGAGELSVAVNVSAQQLVRGDLALSVERTLARQRFAPKLIELELTETVAAGDVAHIGALFRRLRAIGVRIAIDDFGTGYSSLSYLRTLAFDKIKIDREFVTEVDRRRDSQAICQSVIALGRGLGIRVLAEGVERREEYEWLRRHGCGLFQGYLFSRPLSAVDFATFVANRAGVARATALSPQALQHQIVERLSA